MSSQLKKAISLASRDIADALSSGHGGNSVVAMEQFLDAALWAAASAAESLSANAWIDPRIDDGWTREAKSELPPASLSGDVSDADFRFIAENLGQSMEGFLQQIPHRPDVQNALMERFGPRMSIPSPKGDAGKPAGAVPGTPKLDELLKEVRPEPGLKPKLELPEPKPKQPPIETGPDVPPVRKDTANRDNIKPPADEFQSEIPASPIGKQPI